MLDVETARTSLVQQLTSPVQWTRVLETLAASYPDALFVEMGTGAVLSGLARRIAPQIKTARCGTVEDVENLLGLVATHG